MPSTQSINDWADEQGLELGKAIKLIVLCGGRSIIRLWINLLKNSCISVNTVLT